MNITVDLPKDALARLQAEALRRGVSIDLVPPTYQLKSSDSTIHAATMTAEPALVQRTCRRSAAP